ncbi:MAG: hypothetical protein V4635_13050 [Bacteroidota bacterium]
MRTLHLLIVITLVSFGCNGQDSSDSDFVKIKRVSRIIDSKRIDLAMEEFGYPLISIQNLRDSLGFDYYLFREERTFSNFSFILEIFMFKDSVISWAIEPFIIYNSGWGAKRLTPREEKEINKKVKVTEASFKKNAWARMQKRIVNYGSSVFPTTLYGGSIKPGQNKTLDSMMSVHERDKGFIFERVAAKLDKEQLTYLLCSADPLMRAAIAKYLICTKKVSGEHIKKLIGIVIQNSPRVRMRHGCVISRESIVPDMTDCDD